MRSCTINLRLLLALFVLLVHPGNSLASEANARDAGANGAVAVQSPSEEMKRLFYSALNLIYSGEFGPAARNLEEIREIASKMRYANLPDFSFELLRKAEQSAKTEEAAFLLRKAVHLSPTHAAVALAASSSSQLKPAESASILLRGLMLLPHHPLLLTGMLLTLVLVLLLSLTLALAAAAVIQLLVRREEIYTRLAKKIPPSRRGLLSAPLMVMLLVLPLACGLLVAAELWSLTLYRLRRKGRGQLFLCAAVFLAWGMLLPLLSRAAVNIRQQANQVLEETNNGSFTPLGEEFLKNALNEDPTDPLLLFALARIYELKGLDNEADKIYGQLIKTAGRESPFYLPASINIAGAAYLRGDYARAKNVLESLEKEGYSTFEMSYNMALTRLAMLDTNAYRSYYEQAKKMDEARLGRSERFGEEQRKPELAGLPASAYLPLLFRSSESVPVSVYEDYGVKCTRVARALLFHGTPLLLLAAGACFLLLTVLIRARGEVKVAALDRALFSKKFWLFLPAGVQMAGDQALRGIFLLALLLTLIFLYFGFPVSPFVQLPAGASFGTAFLISAAALLVALTLVDYLKRLQLQTAEDSER